MKQEKKEYSKQEKFKRRMMIKYLLLNMLLIIILPKTTKKSKSSKRNWVALEHNTRFRMNPLPKGRKNDKAKKVCEREPLALLGVLLSG